MNGKWEIGFLHLNQPFNINKKGEAEASPSHAGSADTGRDVANEVMRSREAPRTYPGRRASQLRAAMILRRSRAHHD